MAEQVIMVALSALKPHLRNSEFFDDADDASFKNLKDSIKDLGVLTPLRIASDMTIISGHQRYRACSELGLTQVPTIIVEGEMSEDDKLQQLIASNFGRLKNDPVKQGRLIKEYEKLAGIVRGGDQGAKRNNCALLAQEDIAKQLGVSIRTLQNLKGLANLPQELQDLITTGKITPTAGFTVLSKLSAEEQRKLILSLPENERLTTAQLQDLAERARNAETKLEEAKDMAKDASRKATTAETLLRKAKEEVAPPFEGRKEMEDQINKLKASVTTSTQKIAELDALLLKVPESVEVEVVPPDYEALKKRAADGDAAVAALNDARAELAAALASKRPSKVPANLADQTSLFTKTPEAAPVESSEQIRAIVSKIHALVDTQLVPIYTNLNQYVNIAEAAKETAINQCSDIVAILGRVQKLFKEGDSK